jgi:hypothetical protein
MQNENGLGTTVIFVPGATSSVVLTWKRVTVADEAPTWITDIARLTVKATPSTTTRLTNRCAENADLFSCPCVTWTPLLAGKRISEKMARVASTRPDTGETTSPSYLPGATNGLLTKRGQGERFVAATLPHSRRNTSQGAW